MTEFLWGAAGCAVGAAIMTVVLRTVLGVFAEPEELEPTVSDKVIGFLLGVIAALVSTTVVSALVIDPGPFLRGLAFGVGIAVMMVGELLVSAARGHRRPAGPATTAVARPSARVAPMAFPDAVHRHFADPATRARYLSAARRRGLIAGGDATDAPAPSADADWAVIVEQLVYAALISDDPMVRLATVDVLAPPVRPRELEDWEVRHRVDRARYRIEEAFATRYGEELPPGVHRHFADPTVRANDLIAGYRRDLVGSGEVPQLAAEIIADLPGAGEAWTELAMESEAAVRSDLLPLLDRAAEEIGYDRSAQQQEMDVLESAAYRAVVDGRVDEESRMLHRLDFGDWSFEYDHPAELKELWNAHYIAGDYYYEQFMDVRVTLAAYLTARYA